MVMESLTFAWHLVPSTNLNSTCGIGMDYVLIRIVKVMLQVRNLQFILFLPRFLTNGPKLMALQLCYLISSDRHLILMLVIKMVGNHVTNINYFRYVSLLLFWSFTGETIHLYQLIQMTALYAVTSEKSCLK